MQKTVQHAVNFAIAIGEIEAKIVPIRVYNVARGTTILERELRSAVRRFRAELKYDSSRPGCPWFVRFPDESEFNPSAEVLAPLRRISINSRMAA